MSRAATSSDRMRSYRERDAGNDVNERRSVRNGAMGAGAMSEAKPAGANHAAL